MRQRIKSILRALLPAAASTIHYLYLNRIPFLGWVALLALPLLATGGGRPLVLGAYDLSSPLEGFVVGLTYGLAGGSIFFTALVVTNLCSKRFRLRVKPRVQRAIQRVWTLAILVAFFFNIATVIRASEASVDFSVRIVFAISGGISLALLIAYAGGVICAKLGDNPFYRGLVWFGIAIGLRKQPGYLYPVSVNNLQTTNPQAWEYENGQIRAASYAILVIGIYCLVTDYQIPPIAAVMLLLSLYVLVLTGVTFFFDRYRLPVLVIIVAYFWVMGFCTKADHYYRVWPRPEMSSQLAPIEVVGRATQQHRPLVIVAAAGGGIQSAAWTASVLNQLGKRLAAEPGGGYDFPHSVRLISGVSGGSVGGMFYSETFDEPTPDFTHSFQAASASGLGPTVRGLLRQDLWRALAPFFVSDICDDRARILEKKWCDNFDRKFSPQRKLADATLSEWGMDALALKRPALVLNSTIVETGERLAISTVPKRRRLVGEIEFNDRYCADTAVSTAARLSATFPFITPTGRPTMRDQSSLRSNEGAQSNRLCSGGDQHLVDGGYYENSGLIGAIEWVDEALTDLTNPKTNPMNYPVPDNILLLVIDGFEKPYDPEDMNQAISTPSIPSVPADVAHGVLYNLASPLRAVVNVRGSGQQSFARRLLRMFQWRWKLEHINIQDVKIFFDVKRPENREEDVPISQKTHALAGKQPAGRFYIGVDPGKEPLSWHLRPVEVNELAKEWVGLTDFSHPPDNYQTILEFFRTEAGVH